MPLHEPPRPIESRSAEQPRIAGQRLGADGVPAEVPCTYWTRLVVTARVHTIFFNISESAVPFAIMCQFPLTGPPFLCIWLGVLQVQPNGC